MLKFSLHARVTNSMRVSLPKELRRAVEAARLAQTPVGDAARRIAPRFTILQDPAYLADPGRGRLLACCCARTAGRGARADVTALTVLCQDHPFGGRSRLANIVGALARTAARRRRSRASGSRATARPSSSRSCGSTSTSGCASSRTSRTRCSSSTAAGRSAASCATARATSTARPRTPTCARSSPALGEASESIFPEALADERLVYYPFVNNALGVIDALGAGGCIDERVLLGDLRALLERERAARRPLPAHAARPPARRRRWPCKANLRTRLNDMDELVGDIAEQSVYVTLPNPLRA